MVQFYAYGETTYHITHDGRVLSYNGRGAARTGAVQRQGLPPCQAQRQDLQGASPRGTGVHPQPPPPPLRHPLRWRPHKQSCEQPHVER